MQRPLPLGLLVSLVLGGCGQPAAETIGADRATETSNDSASDDCSRRERRVLAEQVVGSPEAMAVLLLEAKGCEARVISRDGDDLIVTMDFKPHRGNLVIVGRRVERFDGWR